MAIGSATRDHHRAVVARSWLQGVIVVLLLLMKLMKLSYRTASTTAQKLPAAWEQQVELLSLRIAFISYIHNELIINMDQTGMCIVPLGKKTFAFKGSQHVVLLGVDDYCSWRDPPPSSHLPGQDSSLLTQGACHGRPASTRLPSNVLRKPLGKHGDHASLG